LAPFPGYFTVQLYFTKTKFLLTVHITDTKTVQSLVNFSNYNPFAPLEKNNSKSNQEEEMEEGGMEKEKEDKEEKEEEVKSDPTPKPTTSKRPPALFIYEITHQYRFKQSLAKACNEEPLSYPSADGMKLHFKTMAAFDKALAYCKQTDQQYATERPREDRP